MRVDQAECNIISTLEILFSLSSTSFCCPGGKSIGDVTGFMRVVYTGEDKMKTISLLDILEGRHNDQSDHSSIVMSS